MAESLKEVIASLEKQRVAIEKALEALRDVENIGGGASPGRPRGARKVGRPPAATRRGRISEEGRKRLAEAMKRRWAVKRAASATKKKK